jgi:hypothetical protein
LLHENCWVDLMPPEGEHLSAVLTRRVLRTAAERAGCGLEVDFHSRISETIAIS